ncbi:hypothetical protein DMP16_01465 [Sulfolobus sp. B1]|uniref:hypothetical protein n=1 Tax=Sulfolobaceae TaxID=118883 RepID=UPI0009F47A9C|nr:MULTISPECIES: hypothetical protein [unclassified Sulfolobus]TRM75066.1 hypothetical protein DJ532_11205 [Sulfolobus sp. A20-N-F8]TRM78490.1 hypothetical protein DJ528_04740 [Sulfolobus sp. B5]TRM80173.1 hypothetical protein DJ524_08470 [Sulfolobus sp. D5]TRN02205.1 hypothetical protein DJ527_04215 [Sulfolobus sp. F1]TRN03884.1 hypothetical protein DJ530_02210 [Sulfolobus sp. E1]
MKMRFILTFALLLLVAGSIITLSSTIVVNYPSSAYLGQEITIYFQLLNSYINSTDFPIISSGVEVIHNGSEVAYTGTPPGGGYLLFPANISNNTTELIVTFVGEYHTYYFTNLGIVLYGGNFKPPLPEGDQRYFSLVLIAFNGRLWYHINGSWYNPLSSLPYYGSVIDNWINVSTLVNYAVVLEEHNGLTFVKDMFINGKEFVINYLTPVLWNFSYVGIRTDTPNNLITPLGFTVYSPLSHQLYVIYVNGKEYASGYTNDLGQGSISLKVSSLHEVINITFPMVHVYKIITISSSQGNVKVSYPIFPLSLLGVSIILTTISVMVSLRRK